MLIAERSSFLTWTNPYVTRGLVAMWDGEWNVKGGVHDAAATTWKDLVRDEYGSYSKTNETPNWGEKYWESTSATDGRYFNITVPSLVDGDGSTIEVVVQKSTTVRGIIFGSYGIAGANGCNVEWFTNNIIRYYYSGFPNVQSSSGAFMTGSAYYFAGLRNGTNYSISDGIQTIVAQSSSGLTFKSSSSRIGCDSRSNMCFNGRIYAIRMYSRALAAGEIAHNYAVDVKRFKLTEGGGHDLTLIVACLWHANISSSYAAHSWKEAA